MRITRHLDAASFLDEAGAHMAEREAFHNLPLAVAAQCRGDPSRYPGPNYFAVVSDGGRVCGVSLMTPPYRVQVYVPPGAAVSAVANDLAHGSLRVSGVHGPVDAVGEFAAAWCARRDVRSRVHTNLRTFELTTVTPTPRARGRMRPAVELDVPVAEAWYRAFHREMASAPGNLTPEELGAKAVREGRVFLWDDGGVVALAGVGGSTPNGARIGPVYTPPDRRRSGYATSLVSDLSQSLLDGGRSFCFLFTDLANPTSNAIYRRIGYRAVADFRDIDFEPA